MVSLGAAGMAVSSLVTITGNVITIIAINFWLLEFPASASPQLAIQFVSSALYWMLFVLFAIGMCVKFGRKVVWRAIVGPAALGGKPWKRLLPRVWLLFVCGLTDIGSNLLSLYATPHTPEILQALLQVTIAFFALIISMIFVREERAKNHGHPLLITAFVLLALGLAVASRGTILAATRMDGSLSQIAWIVIYLLSCVVYGGWSVAQRMYLDRSIADETGCGEERLLLGAIQEEERGVDEVSNGSSHQLLLAAAGSDENDLGPVPDVVHKSIMLLGDASFQLILCIVLLPVDTIPWFGNSSSLKATWQGFSNGVDYVFTEPSNFKYGLLYSFGYFVTYFGEGYLNHYSPTLASIVLQLSSPVTAILLLIVPQWNVDQGEALWWCQAIAIAVLLAASVVYQRWEMLQRRTLQG